MLFSRTCLTAVAIAVQELCPQYAYLTQVPLDPRVN